MKIACRSQWRDRTGVTPVSLFDVTLTDLWKKPNRILAPNCMFRQGNLGEHREHFLGEGYTRFAGTVKSAIVGFEMQRQAAPRKSSRHPPWLKVRAPFGPQVHQLRTLLNGLQLNTVCQEAMCPNMGECWSHGVATFMILGDICTRGCRYCAVTKGRPKTLELGEPRRVAEAAEAMKLKHVVITSVDRDDLEDGGAGVFAATVREVRKRLPDCTVEVLVPDFQGCVESLGIVLKANPEILNHNVETVPRLYPTARGGGDYAVTLQLLGRAKKLSPQVVTKTGMMLGLGETEKEITTVLTDLVAQGVSILTLGQYLRPTGWHLPVARHYRPEEFLAWKIRGEKMGFQHVASGPLVRSSYLADRQFQALQKGSSTHSGGP